MEAVIGYFDELEAHACRRINRLSRHAGMRSLFVVVSRLGDGGFWLATGLAVLVLDGVDALPGLVQMTLTGAAGILIYKSLKERLVRERPYVRHGEILCATAPLDRYSFPSGHTLHAVSFTVLLGHAEPVVLPVVLPFAVLVAASRVILGLHYPTDVAVGAIIGALLAVASLLLY